MKNVSENKMSPKVEKWIVSRKECLQRKIEDCNEKRESYTDDAEWLSWYGSTLVNASTKLSILRRLENANDAAIVRFIEQTKQNLIDGFGIKHSTNAMSNAVSVFKHEATCEILRELISLMV